MNSRTTENFRKLFSALSPAVRRRARRAYAAWKRDPHSKGLNFKRVNQNMPIYAVRIGLDYRALGLLQDDAIVWYWVGKHDDYERILRQR